MGENRSRWIRVSIAIGAWLFILALAVSAAVVPQLRVLHVFQALIYVAVLVLTCRNRPWGFGIGVIIPVAWNCLNLFVTHLFQAGALQFWSLVSTGHVSRPDTLMVMVGGMAHFLLMIACMDSAAAAHVAMEAVLCRRLSGVSLLWFDHRRRSSTLAFLLGSQTCRPARWLLLGWSYPFFLSLCVGLPLLSGCNVQ